MVNFGDARVSTLHIFIMSNSPTCQLTDGNYNILTNSGEYLGISNNSLAVDNYPTVSLVTFQLTF